MEILSYQFDNKSLEKQVRARLARVKDILPSWVQNVTIQARGESGDSRILTVDLSPPYRRITISIFSKFYEYTKAHQEWLLLHEVAHTCYGQAIDWVDDVLLPPIKDRNPELYEHLDAQWVRIVESDTESLTFLLGKLIGLDPKDLGT